MKLELLPPRLQKKYLIDNGYTLPSGNLGTFTEDSWNGSSVTFQVPVRSTFDVDFLILVFCTAFALFRSPKRMAYEALSIDIVRRVRPVTIIQRQPCSIRIRCRIYHHPDRCRRNLIGRTLCQQEAEGEVDSDPRIWIARPVTFSDPLRLNNIRHRVPDHTRLAKSIWIGTFVSRFIFALDPFFQFANKWYEISELPIVSKKIYRQILRSPWQ